MAQYYLPTEGIPGDFGTSGTPQGPFNPIRQERNPWELRNILDDRFIPEFERLQGGMSDLEGEFLRRLRAGPDYEAFRGEISAFGESLVNDLFGAGGQVEQATREALGQSAARGGFGFNRARQNIFKGATDTVASEIARNALGVAQLAEQSDQADLGALLGFTQFQGGRLENLRESLFGGGTQIEQLGLARQQADLNRRLVEQALRQQGGGGIGGFLGQLGGGILGGVVGSALGPVGTALGGKAVDWLGLGE